MKLYKSASTLHNLVNNNNKLTISVDIKMHLLNLVIFVLCVACSMAIYEPHWEQQSIIKHKIDSDDDVPSAVPLARGLINILFLCFSIMYK